MRRRRLKNSYQIVILMLLFVGVAIGVAFLFDDPYQVEMRDGLKELPLNDIDKSLFKGDELKTYEDDKYYSRLGVDVSAHNQEVDYEGLKDMGVEFVFIRLGYRGYSEGGLNLDTYFRHNYERAKEAGLEVGVYFFSQAINEHEAIEEALFVIEALKGLDLDLEVAYDLEDGHANGRIKDLSKEEKSRNALAFCAKIEELGYEPLIYSNLHWLENEYVLEDILNYPIWFAQYSDHPDMIYPFKMWQYSDSLTFNDERAIDMNIRFEEK